MNKEILDRPKASHRCITENTQGLIVKRNALVVSLAEACHTHHTLITREDYGPLRGLRNEIIEKARMLTEVVAELAKESGVTEDARNAIP